MKRRERPWLLLPKSEGSSFFQTNFKNPSKATGRQPRARSATRLRSLLIESGQIRLASSPKDVAIK